MAFTADCEAVFSEAGLQQSTVQELSTRFTETVLRASVKHIPRGARTNPKLWAPDPGHVNSSGPDLGDHGQVVAPHVRAHIPGCLPGQGSAADSQVGSGLAAGAVAGVRGFCRVQRGPPHSILPCRYPLLYRVCRLTAMVPEGVVPVEISQD